MTSPEEASSAPSEKTLPPRAVLCLHLFSGKRQLRTSTADSCRQTHTLTHTIGVFYALSAMLSPSPAQGVRKYGFRSRLGYEQAQQLSKFLRLCVVTFPVSLPLSLSVGLSVTPPSHVDPARRPPRRRTSQLAASHAGRAPSRLLASAPAPALLLPLPAPPLHGTEAHSRSGGWRDRGAHCRGGWGATQPCRNDV